MVVAALVDTTLVCRSRFPCRAGGWLCVLVCRQFADDDPTVAVEVQENGKLVGADLEDEEEVPQDTDEEEAGDGSDDDDDDGGGKKRKRRRRKGGDSDDGSDVDAASDGVGDEEEVDDDGGEDEGGEAAAGGAQVRAGKGLRAPKLAVSQRPTATVGVLVGRTSLLCVGLAISRTLLPSAHCAGGAWFASRACLVAWATCFVCVCVCACARARFRALGRRRRGRV
jgi:hypothetical protein